MKKIFILSFSVIILFANSSCIARSSMDPNEKKYTLKLFMDYYGDNITAYNNDVSIKLYKTKGDVFAGNVVKEYRGVNFSVGSMPVKVLDKYFVSVTVIPSAPNTYIMEDGIPNFDTTAVEHTFTMDRDRSIFVLFSKKALEYMDEIEYDIISGSGGDVYFSITRLIDNSVVETRKISSSEHKILKIPEYFLGNNKYKIELKATPIVTETSRYTFTKWSGTGINEVLPTYKITTTSPTHPGSITGTFTYVDKHYGVIEKPTETTIDGANRWIMISSPKHLLWLADAVNKNDPPDARDGHYKLAKDIDYKGTCYFPIGNDDYYFRGIINGNNNKILNAKFAMSSGGSFTYTGFVGYMDGGIISNLTIDQSCEINSSASYVGSIAGYSSGGIYNCINKANINTYGSYCIGGIAGSFQGIISNVYNTGNIKIDSSASSIFAGGIAGYNWGQVLYLKNAYNTGNITYNGNLTKVNIGGVIGYVDLNIYITNVYNTGTINNSGTTKRTGGIFGRVLSVYVFQAANVYFTGSDSLPHTGFGSRSPIPSDANVVGRIDDLSGLEATFNTVTGMNGVWKAGPNNRPIIAVLPAE